MRGGAPHRKTGRVRLLQSYWWKKRESKLNRARRALSVPTEPFSDDFRCRAWEASFITAGFSSASNGYFFSCTMAGSLWCVFHVWIVYFWRESSKITSTRVYHSLGGLTWNSVRKQNQIRAFVIVFGSLGGLFPDFCAGRGRCRARAQARHHCWLLRSKLLAGFIVTADSGNYSHWQWNHNGPRWFYRKRNKYEKQTNKQTKSKRMTRASFTLIKSDQKAETRNGVGHMWLLIGASWRTWRNPHGL